MIGRGRKKKKAEPSSPGIKDFAKLFDPDRPQTQSVTRARSLMTQSDQSSSSQGSTVEPSRTVSSAESRVVSALMAGIEGSGPEIETPPYAQFVTETQKKLDDMMALLTRLATGDDQRRQEDQRRREEERKREEEERDRDRKRDREDRDRDRDDERDRSRDRERDREDERDRTRDRERQSRRDREAGSSSKGPLTREEVEQMLQKVRDDSRVKKGTNPPYPAWMDEEPFPPKFKQPNLQSYDGKGSPQQHLCHFKVLTADNDALKIRLFISTLKETAFDWYQMLPEGSINSWKDMEERFLNHFFEEDDSVTTARLCSTKQGEKESASAFIKRWRALSVKCPENLSQESLTDMCRTNLHTKLRAKMVGARPKTLADLLDAAVEAEAIIRDREQEKRTQKRTETPKTGGKKKESLMVQAAPAPVEKKKDEKEDKRGKNRPTLKERMAKEYDFDVEDSENLFHQLLANGKIQLPSCKRPAEEGKTNDPKYCLFHRIISHNIKDCFVFKEKVQELLDKNVISLAKEEKKVTTNMVSMQFGDFPVIVPVQHEEQDDVEFRLIKDSDDSDDGLVPVELPDGSAMWVHPDLMEDEDWEIVKPRSHSRVVQTPLVPAYKGQRNLRTRSRRKRTRFNPLISWNNNLGSPARWPSLFPLNFSKNQVKPQVCPKSLRF